MAFKHFNLPEMHFETNFFFSIKTPLSPPLTLRTIVASADHPLSKPWQFFLNLPLYVKSHKHIEHIHIF